MLSVIIPTLDSERALVRTLAPLVSGATAGLITEVTVVDGGSHDDTAIVADVSGCNFMTISGPPGLRLKKAAAAARGRWLMFLQPGTVLDTMWTEEARRFADLPGSAERAAVFRRARLAQSAVGELASLITAALGALPRPEQGLLIAKAFYDALGGHSADAADAEAELVRRVGRRRIARLSTNAFHNT
jgi:glycosyltransferase involved in cell wall biosynthesis